MKKFIIILCLLISSISFAKCTGHEHKEFSFGSSIEASIALPEFDRIIGNGRKAESVVLSGTEVMYIYYNNTTIDIVHKNDNIVTVTLHINPKKCDFYKYYF